MSKDRNTDPDLRDEYDFSGGERGKYAERFAEGSNVVVLDPDIARRFADSPSVNDALRTLVEERPNARALGPTTDHGVDQLGRAPGRP